ncbi:MAG TPA: GFA family protein [Xanthomonadaceae bacterium]|nr:GFA family protein [Xanthomonadaceae bacterium]
MTEATGSCLCGAVRFAAQLPSKWVAHCHCSMCRRAHGAAFVTWAGFPQQQCAIQDPDQVLHWYASSPGAERGFCGRCGSTLFFRSERWAGELHIVRANFDGELDRTPQAHVFWDAHVDWVQLPPDDGLPRKTPGGA